MISRQFLYRLRIFMKTLKKSMIYFMVRMSKMIKNIEDK